jgi:hypothetical protein
MLPPRLPHLLLAITADFFRLIVESTLAVLSHKVAGQSLRQHWRQWRLQTRGNRNDGIDHGLVRFIFLGDCCISSLGNGNDGATLYLYNIQRTTPVP